MRIEQKGKIPVKEYGWMTRDGSVWDISYEGETFMTVEDGPKYAMLGLDRYRLLGLEDGTARVIRFADLHRHSDNSLQDSILKVSDMVEGTEYAGALTDHGNMYGFVEYYEGMKKAGKKPILGTEAYMEGMDGRLSRNHVILLAKDYEGYLNLLKLSSESFEHFKSVPHMTWEMLERYHKGVICLSGCLGGVIPKALKNGEQATADAAVERFISIFGKEDFYIEIQAHGIADEDRIRPLLVAMAEQHGLKVLATTDTHYLAPEDATAHDVVLCLRTGHCINDDQDRLRYDGDGYYLHTSEDMEARFADYPEALDNTLELADRCDVGLELGKVALPDYEIPEGFGSVDGYMRHIAEEGFRARFEGTPRLTDRKYLDRFEYEMATIKKMDFCGYFIIVWDLIDYARKHGIYVGPGRGSAAGSLVAYCMGITDLDPIEYDLLFERFLNPERISFPDVDTDIEHSGRGKVIQYMTQKYGADHVCRIVTFGTFAAKQALLDVARVFGLPASYGIKLSGLVPKGPKVTLKGALEKSEGLAQRYSQDKTARNLIDIAMKIEGCKRHASQHACGICVAPGAVSDYLPTSMEIDPETGEKALTSQVTMSEVEKLGLIKMDLLGLKNLTVIHECLDSAQRNYGKQGVLAQIRSDAGEVRYQDIPLDDRETYRMLAFGLTGGVFQFEGSEITKVLQEMLRGIDEMTDEELGTVAFERLIAAVALYRPGPMDYIPDYLQGSKEPRSVQYDCPEEESILSSTYGVMVYQEQLMQIARVVAGYSMGEADILRKSCGKKKKDMMEKERSRFIYGNKERFESGEEGHRVPGCVGNGVSEAVATKIWDKMEKFASYAFNRSHAACYAYIGYLTAYLSCHWPREFYAAMLNVSIENSAKSKTYLGQAERRGIALQLPDIQESMCGFTANGAGILYGLQGISGVKRMAVHIVRDREENGPFLDLQDFYRRMADRGAKVDKKSIENLIYSGAMRTFSPNKAALVEQYPSVERDYKANAKQRAMGQISMFKTEEEKLALPDVAPFPKDYELKKEADALGTFISAHPADLYQETVAARRDYRPLETIEGPLAHIKTLGLIRDLETFFTKAGKAMATFIMSTRTKEIPCVMFPDAFEEHQDELRGDIVLCACGDIKVDDRDGAELQFVVKELIRPEVDLDVPDAVIIEVHDKAEQDAVIDFVCSHPGDRPVVLKAFGHLFKTRMKVDGLAIESWMSQAV